ncbi:cell division protein FtsL [Haliangium sp.]|uniref:cell division protein FtsL n=1 Tax=Haliangium sp. TaxID=2663208 RepID=UPI003D12BAC6
MSAPSVKIAVAGMVVFALLVAGLGVAHVARRQEVIQLGYQLAKATDDLAREQEENRRLRLEKSILTNPARIRHLAESLGMTPPGPDQIRVVRAPAAPSPELAAEPAAAPREPMSVATGPRDHGQEQVR